MLYEELIEQVPWIHGVYNMFGKPVPTPRLLYCMRDEDFDVTNSYKVTGSMVWTKNVLKLKGMVENTTNKKYKYAQLNYYRNGEDYIGYHTDSEVRPGDIIASISLGTERKFRFRSINYKTDHLPVHEIDLQPRSLVLMNEHVAKLNWKHMLPKMSTVKTGRINITFRPN